MSEVIVNDANFKSEITDFAGVALVDFWAQWCGPCQMMGPVIEELAADFAGRVKIAKLNVDENPQTSAMFGVTAIPTLVIFKGGKALDKIVGFQSKNVIESKLKAHL